MISLIEGAYIYSIFSSVPLTCYIAARIYIYFTESYSMDANSFHDCVHYFIMTLNNLHKVSYSFKTVFFNPKYYFECKNGWLGELDLERNLLVLLGLFFCGFRNGC